MKPSGERAESASGSRLDVRAQDVEPPGRRGVEHVELRAGGEQRLERLGLPVIERGQDRREPARVARATRAPGRSASSARTRSASPVWIAANSSIHGRGRYRSSPQTSSVTSLVNAASARNGFGLPREVSANADRPGLHPRAVAAAAAAGRAAARGAARPAAGGRAGAGGRAAAGRSSSGCSLPLQVTLPPSLTTTSTLALRSAPRALDLEQVRRRRAAAGQRQRERGGRRARAASQDDELRARPPRAGSAASRSRRPAAPRSPPGRRPSPRPPPRTPRSARPSSASAVSRSSASVRANTARPASARRAAPRRLAARAPRASSSSSTPSAP